MELLTGSLCNNRGSLTLFRQNGLMVQDDSQDHTECKVADEPVVVLNLWPMKAGNSVEDKTKETSSGGLED